MQLSLGATTRSVKLWSPITTGPESSTLRAEKLVGHKKIHYSRTDFQELMQTFDNQVDGIAALEADTFHHLLVYLATRTFTDEVHEHWKLYSSSLHTPVTYTNVKTFINDCLNTMDDDGPSILFSKLRPPQSSRKQSKLLAPERHIVILYIERN